MYAESEKFSYGLYNQNRCLNKFILARGLMIRKTNNQKHLLPPFSIHYQILVCGIAVFKELFWELEYVCGIFNFTKTKDSLNGEYKGLTCTNYAFFYQSQIFQTVKKVDYYWFCGIAFKSQPHDFFQLLTSQLSQFYVRSQLGYYFNKF